MSTEAYCGTNLAVRVIPCLDVDGGRVVKGVNFENLRDAGDPVELAAAPGVHAQILEILRRVGRPDEY